MFSSEKSLQKRTIMDYLPEHQRAKVRKLVERLAQQTQQKEKFKKLYEQMVEKYQQLNKKYEELQQHCSDLKSQIATSRMAINKAKQAYIASKSAKKVKKIQDFNNTEFQSENKLDTQSLKQTWMKIPKSYLNTKSSAQKQDRKQYIFQQNENFQGKSNFNVNQNEKLYPPLPLAQRFQQTSLKKTAPRKNYKDTIIQSSNKKEQIINLRRQIQSLTQQMKKKETTGLPLNQKIKKCQQIKNRYLKSKQKAKKRKNESQSQQNNSGDQSDDQGDRKSQSKSRISKYYQNKGMKSKRQLYKLTQKQQQAKESHRHYRDQSNSQKDKHQQQQSQQQYIQKGSGNKEKKSQNHFKESIKTQKQDKSLKKESKLISKSKIQNQQEPKSKKVLKQQTKEVNKTERSKKESRKINSQNKFDQSLFAIINQLNAGN